MHSRTWMTLIAGALAISLGGCSDEQPSEPPMTVRAQMSARTAGISRAEADKELALLMERTEKLKAQVVKAGKMSPDLRREVEVLAKDIASWQARTGRKDISAVKTTHTMSRKNDGGGPSCGECPGYTLEGDEICFLLDDQGCVPSEPDDDLIIGPVCVYLCITMVKATSAEVGRHAQSM